MIFIGETARKEENSLQSYLEDTNFEAETFSDAEEFFNKLKTGNSPDLFILTRNFIKENGSDFIKKTREEYKSNAPAIVVSEPYDVKFSTYAVPMIAGEIKRFMRDDGAIKVSRTLKRTAREINAFIESYSISHGEQPDVKTIAAAFDMEEGDVVFALDSGKMPLSIYEQGEYKDEKTQELAEKLPVRDTQEEMIENLQLHSAIESLPERERKIIVLRYFRDMTQSEVAKQIGVSQVQISRIEMKIMKEFKLRLAE